MPKEKIRGGETIKTKYSPGQKVWALVKKAVSRTCKDCLGEKELTLADGRTLECRECSGTGTDDGLEGRYEIGVRETRILSVLVRIALYKKYSDIHYQLESAYDKWDEFVHGVSPAEKYIFDNKADALKEAAKTRSVWGRMEEKEDDDEE